MATETRPELHHILAKRLREWRAKQGLTQAALAQRMGVSQQIIARIESEGGRDVRLSTVRALMAALQVRARDLLE
jgi:predicted transcriptional regulator